MASFGLKKFKRNGASSDKVRLKCFFGEEISVLTVPSDIKYRHLKAKIEEIFGEGVAIHKYEDHVGDLITVHSKHDVREAFTLYAKAIRKQSKRDAVEPYLKLHLAREPNPSPNNTGPGTGTATPGTTPPSGATTPGPGGSGGGEATSAPVHRRQSSREKEKDREAREERGGGGLLGANGYNRPISKSSPVLPSRMALSKSPPKSPPESPTSQQRRRSWGRHGPPLPRKEPASSSGGSSGGGSPAGKKRSSGKERGLEKKEKRRKKRISWKDAKGKLIEQRRGDDGDNHREESEGEGEGGGGEQEEGEEYAGGAALRRELSGSGGSNSSSGGRGRSFIRRLTPTNKKKIERTKSADDKDEVARSEVGDDIRKRDRDAGAGGSETETETTTDDDDVERLVSPQTTSGETESHDDDDDVRSVDGANGEGEKFEGGEGSLDGVYAALAEEASTESGSESSTEQSETEHGGEGEEEEGEAFDDDDDSEGEGEGDRRPRRKQQPTVYSPLVQHLPSGSPPVVPAHEPLSATKRMKLTIQTDMEELNWDVPAKALGSSRGRSNSDSSVINPPPATHTPPGMSPRSSFSEFSTQPLLTSAEYADYINAVPIHMRPSQPPALSSPDSHLPSFPGSPNPNVPLVTPSGIGLPPILFPPDLASPTSHLPSVDLGSGHLTFTGTLPIAISAPPAVGGVVESPATLTRSVSPPPPIVLPAIVSSSAATDPPPLSSPTSHLPSSVFSDEYFPPLDEPLVDELTASVIEGLVPFRTPPKSSILRDVNDPLEEILDDEQPLGGGGGTIIIGQQPGEQPHASEAVQDMISDAAAALLAKSTKSDRVKRKGKKKRKLGGKAKKASSGKITLAGYCEDWSKVNWQPGIKLGSGAFGVVYVGLREDGAMFAVKQIVLRPDDDASAATSKEIEVMKGIHHDNIVQYLGTLVKDNILNIFMEYVPGGSLSSLVSFYGALKEQTIRRYTKQILHGLVYLHKSGIVHRDIKGANILVDPSGKVKLADFGCSKKFSNATVGTANYKSIVGTPWWMAPEVFRSTGYGRAADIWSLGCTIIEMATCHPPWSECTNMVATLFKISHTDQLPDIPASLSRHCKDFLAQCFIREPKQRPTAAQLLLHPFITLKGGSDDQTDEPSSSGGGGGAPSPKEDAGGKAWRMKKQIQSLASLITSTAGVFRLPKTLALHIFSFLPARDIDSLAQVCKYWSLLAMELWEQRCSRWPCKAMKSVKVRNGNRGKGPNWRRLYIEGDERERRVRSASVAVTTLKGHHKSVFAVQLLDSPNRIASGSEDKRLRFWEFTKGKWRLAHSAKAHTEGIYSLNFDSRNDNKLLMSGSVDKSIRIWDVTKYKNVRTITAAHEWGVTGLQYDSSNGILASSALDGTIKLWNVETGKNVATLRGHTRGVYCCACRDNLVVSGSVDETVRLWDKRDGSCIAVLKGHSDDVTSVQLDAQADNVVSGSGDATIRCWDIGTGECWNTWSEETATAARSPQEGSNKHWVWGVDLTANHVFSASQDKTIKIWDFTTGACLRTLAGEEGHQGSVQALVAGRDRLVSAGKDATVKVWQFEGLRF